jgi:ribosome-binding protein aMBF1 (putative translation factor)
LEKNSFESKYQTPKLHGGDLSLSEGELKDYRKSNENKSISHYLQKIYYERTDHALSKSELGTKIGEMSIFVGERDASPLQPEEVLRKIEQRLNQRR